MQFLCQIKNEDQVSFKLVSLLNTGVDSQGFNELYSTFYPDQNSSEILSCEEVKISINNQLELRGLLCMVYKAYF